jgi:hypothetical protein
MKLTTEVLDQINYYKSTRGVLVYANDSIYTKLAEDHYFPRVTEQTPH